MGGDHLWDAIGAVGQMLGSMAVFITRGYLAVQVKHARSEMRRPLSQGRFGGLIDLLIAQNAERNHMSKAAMLTHSPISLSCAQPRPVPSFEFHRPYRKYTPKPSAR